MNWFRSNTPEVADTVDLCDHLGAEISTLAEQIQMPITDYAADAATAMLAYADHEITECDRILAEYSERRERAILTREAFAPVLARLESGVDLQHVCDPHGEPQSPPARPKRSKPALVQAGE